MKKKGSALILVLCIMGVLSIISISILGVTTNDNKLRNKESKHSASFYGADLGIDASYTVLNDEINKALENGKNKGNEFLKNWRCSEKYGIHTPECEKRKQRDMNEAFKSGYVSYIKENIKKNLEYCTKNYENKNYDFLKGKIKGDLKIEANPTFKYDYDGEKLELLEIVSTYSKDNKEERSVKKIYEFLSPTINDSDDDSKMIDIDKLFNYVCVADGNLTINNSASLAIHGDVWCGGLNGENTKQNECALKVINKNCANTSIHGKLSCADDLDLRGGSLNSYSNIEGDNKGDMYLNNIYLKNNCKLGVGGNLYFLNNIYMRSDESEKGNDVQIKGDLCGLNNIEEGDFNKKSNGIIFNPIRCSCFEDINNIYKGISDVRRRYDCCEKCINSLGKIKIEGDLILEGTPYTKTQAQTVEPFLFYDWSYVYGDLNRDYKQKEDALINLINYNYNGKYFFSDPYKKIYNNSIEINGESYIKGIGVRNDEFIKDTIKDYDREKLTNMEKEFSKEVFGMSQEESLPMLNKKQVFHSLDKSINWDGVKDYIKKNGRNDYYCEKIKSWEKEKKENFYIIYNISGEKITINEGKCYIDNKMVVNIKNDKKNKALVISNGDIEYKSEFNNSEDYIFYSSKNIVLNIDNPTNFGNYTGFKNTIKDYFKNYNLELSNQIFGYDEETDEKIDSSKKIIKKSTWSIVK